MDLTYLQYLRFQCAAALFDEHVSDDRALHEPQLYEYTLEGHPYRPWLYWINIFDAIWQSTVIFFVAYFAYMNNADFDVLSFGFALITSMTIVSMIHVLIQATRIDILLISSVLLSLVVFFGFTLIFDAQCVSCLKGESPYQVSYTCFRQGAFWLATLLTIILSLLPRFIGKCFYNTTMNPLMKKTKI